MERKNKLICLVGMGGAGKSEVAEYMMKQHKFGYFRFGQIVLDKVKETGLPPSEKLEKEIREKVRKEHGMAAMAILNRPKIESMIEVGDVLGDGLYSWEEYLYLKDNYPEQFIVIAVYAPPTIRYDRLENRAERHGEDENLRFRSFKKGESWDRDKNEIENVSKAGPIAMADFVLLNTSTRENLHTQIDKVLTEIFD